MKQIIFTAFLIFAFCFAAFAQTNENTNTAPKPTPKLLAEFNDFDNEWYKLTMDILGPELEKSPSATGLIRIRNDKNFPRRLLLVRSGLRIYKMDLSRIILLKANKQEHDTEVLVLPTKTEAPKFENSIVIRIANIGKIEKLPKPKKTIKRRKKK